MAVVGHSVSGRLHDHQRQMRQTIYWREVQCIYVYIINYITFHIYFLFIFDILYLYFFVFYILYFTKKEYKFIIFQELQV